MRNGKIKEIKKAVDDDGVWMKVKAARSVLGISRMKMAALLRSRELPYEIDSMDKRIKRVRKADVERLQRQGLQKVA